MEYAPTDPYRVDPIARLTAQLATSSETTLAIDTGRPTTDHALDDAEREHREVVAQRLAAETSRGRWLPYRRRELEALRRSEAQIGRRVETLRRQQAEQRHGAQPFLEDRVDYSQSREMDRRIAERRLDREQARDLGRGLER